MHGLSSYLLVLLWISNYLKVSSELSHLDIAWCSESLPYSRVGQIIHIEVCPIKPITFSVLVTIEPFSVWCIDEGKSKAHHAKVVGVLDSSFYLWGAPSSIRPCDGKSEPYSYIKSRPSLYYSIFLNDIEYPLQVSQGESVESTADWFLSNLGLSHAAARDFLVADMTQHMEARVAQRLELKRRIDHIRELGRPLRIVIGASNYQIFEDVHAISPEWIGFSVNHLDVLSREDFLFYFEHIHSVDAIVAEHVFEHMSITDALWAFQLCNEFLIEVGGYLRIAVPDWFSYPLNSTAEAVAADIKFLHFVQYNADSLSIMLEQFGSFHVIPREYTASDGSVVFGSLDPLLGRIDRSMCFREAEHPPSLVVDAFTSPSPLVAATERCVSGSIPPSCVPCDVDAAFRVGLGLLGAGDIRGAEWALHVALDMSTARERPLSTSQVTENQIRAQLNEIHAAVLLLGGSEVLA